MKGLHHVGITVKDLDASIRFYHDVLGLEFSNEPSPWFDGRTRARGRRPGRGTSTGQPPARRHDARATRVQEPGERDGSTADVPELGASHVAFVVDDIEAKKAELEAQGIRFYSDVNVVDEGVLAGWRWVYFEDPDGYPAGTRRGRVLQRGRAARGDRGVSRVALLTMKVIRGTDHGRSDRELRRVPEPEDARRSFGA